jgi:putative cardiolipin synthase
MLFGCNDLPSLEGRIESYAFTDTGATRLGKAIAPKAAAHPGLSGIYSLRVAEDAFAARMLLARAAQRSLDIQYYIWRQDLTGTMLFAALREAAERGVRVRLLLDDNNTYGLDPLLAALDAHPNIEIRLFNPLPHRSMRWLDYLLDFPRVNRRMHNKSFTADNQVTIIGGRNIGDEYFGAADDVLFADLDVMAVGPVVGEVSTDFDRYWASGSSYPADRLIGPPAPARTAELSNAARAIEASPAAVSYVDALRRSSFVEQLLHGSLPLEWAVVRMVSDDPAKGLGKASPERLLGRRLQEAIGDPTGAIDLVSPYFVLGATGTDWFTSIARSGVRIRVLTNSLEATDVAAVHAGYAKRRKALLEAGITLYELKLQGGPKAPKQRLGLSSGSSRSSLHAKTFAVDDERVFIGSFNFDLRSLRLNTELGFVIESPALAKQISGTFDESIPLRAYEVRLAENGSLYWLERSGPTVTRHDTEPGTGFWRRFGVYLLSLLPIDWLL